MLSTRALAIACRIVVLAALAAATCGTASADERAPRNQWPDMYNEATDSRTRIDASLGDTAPIPEAQLVPALLKAIDQLSRYRQAAGVPEIYRIPHEQLQQMVCGEPCAALATYRTGEGIYLDQNLKPETSPFDRSVLLHELVHYVQEMNGAHEDLKPCSRWYHREQEAYAIQKTFLMMVGSPIRVGYSASASTCDDEAPR